MMTCLFSYKISDHTLQQEERLGKGYDGSKGWVGSTAVPAWQSPSDVTASRCSNSKMGERRVKVAGREPQKAGYPWQRQGSAPSSIHPPTLRTEGQVARADPRPLAGGGGTHHRDKGGREAFNGGPRMKEVLRDFHCG